MVPPPPEFNLRNQTPILEPPPEFSDARDTHEQATRFNQGHMHNNVGDGHQPFNRQSPMYRSISHSHSSASSMYSGYPTMTRQQYQQQLLHQQQLQQQQQHYQQQQQQSHVQQQQHGVMTMSMPTYQTLGRQPTAYSNVSNSNINTGAQNMLNNPSAYGHYQTLGAPGSKAYAQQQQQAAQQQQQVGSTAAAAVAMYQQQQHHPKCHYYQQGSGQPGPGNSSGGSPMANSIQKDNKHINEKLHPVHRYTPGGFAFMVFCIGQVGMKLMGLFIVFSDIYESSSGPRIVGTIPKQKQPGSDHYEVPHSHQQLLQQQQQQQQQQQSGGNRVRREFRNKNLHDWTIMDSCDWLDSLFMPEYKGIFQQRGIDGKKLVRMDNSTLLELGVKKLGHRMNIEKSLKRYLPQGKS